MPGKNTDTPAMRQYRKFKDAHPGCVLFFRMGDFYEMFFEDAELAHGTLGVTLTQRTEGVPMAGVPYHAVEGYLRRMIQAGHRVAVCDQVEDAKEAKGVLKRDVTRVITPGTLTDESLLDEATPAPLAALAFLADERVALAWAELSTGVFRLATMPSNAARDELARIGPTELLYCETADGQTPQRVQDAAPDCPLTPRPAWPFRASEATELLCKHFKVAELAGFGLTDQDPALGAAACVLHYLQETQNPQSENQGEPASTALQHLRPPKPFALDQHLVIDQTSLASLEVERTLRDRSTNGSLLGVLGNNGRACATAMGKRKLRDWLCFPLTSKDDILDRQRVVVAMVDDDRFVRELGEALDGVHDIPRLIARLSVNRASPRDLVALGQSAAAVQRIVEALEQRPTVQPFHDRVAATREPLFELGRRIHEACLEEAPAHLREGGLIRDGHDKQLDESRGLMQNADAWLAQYQGRICEESGIPSLKVGFNKVFGFYIEVSAANKAKAEEFQQTDAGRAWTRKQTLKNAERYITPELKEYEGNVLTAKDRAVARELALFQQLCDGCAKQLDHFHAFAEAVAELDVLRCFAQRAVKHNYVQPELTDEPVLHVRGGRHPVLDELLQDQFVPNDVELGQDQTSLALITGPNMAGKSTYIRQAALIALLAHTGSFVPADAATVGLCDRIFTRVGAHDELHAGRSTFMVEMTETANICHHATPKSLVILDEIGRGTSTYDGLALAWAITEHLAGQRCRTLFATHYHELTSLGDRGADGHLPGVGNLHVKVREWNHQIVFLHRVEPGATDRSYGIAVAQLAGLPPEVVHRANAILDELTATNHTDAKAARTPRPTTIATEPTLFDPPATPHPALEQLRNLDLNQLSPMDAFDALRKLHAEAQADK
ncbi:MAG: DNA mismatch repair protein MutS [Planctomycetota bacterium]